MPQRVVITPAALDHPHAPWDADVQLRWTTKYAGVEPFLGLAHRGRTRVRLSVNAEPVTGRMEGGTATVADRVQALGRLARAGYPVGLTIAPIMPLPNWRERYAHCWTRWRPRWWASMTWT